VRQAPRRVREALEPFGYYHPRSGPSGRRMRQESLSSPFGSS
jgi:hypothetical protein